MEHGILSRQLEALKQSTIVTQKPFSPAPVQMQETAEAVGWLQWSSGAAEPEISHLIIYQGQDEVYLTLMAPGTRYVEYLGRTAPTTTTDPEEFMTMQTFGPWEIKKEKHLQSLCLVLLALCGYRIRLDQERHRAEQLRGEEPPWHALASSLVNQQEP
ncbi:hypothetical protein CDV55_105862 [Aspergillus turcosus]|uniref:Uncharacterized protein n=1 Tax=Aspergillus turcosus TaxID=1245748 RepID=A0A397H9Y0_9EURO|nr:hypothetical protein CDV55_105862 [Aspergillus turcosus]RLL93602.1 hypothetical protein CFD26_102415 [Aspergillus turcosus]